jgi:uncharacterized membrane protein/thiol-disulfide isomerase/thioredoxin
MKINVSERTIPISSTSPFSFGHRVRSFLLAIWILPVLAAFQPAEPPIVQSILFYSQTCPFCHTVINELLIPMQEQYGDQLQIIGIDVSHPVGNELYVNAIERYEIPKSRQGVPFLIVGEVVLFGSREIPARFPALVEGGLLAGGIGWPDIPDLSLIIPDLPPSASPDSEPEIVILATAESESILQDPEPAPLPTAVPSGDHLSESPLEETSGTTGTVPATPLPVQSLENVNKELSSSISDEPPKDPVGFVLAGLVLIGMVVALIYTAALVIRPFFFNPAFPSSEHDLTWVVPALAIIGLGLALYLSYVEVAQVEAFCGPVGECNIVQASSYAQIMGIPVAVLGALSYIAIVVLWIGQRILPQRLSAISFLSLLVITALGTLFSIYLTMIELFAIKAICAWCVSSAVVTTLLLILVVKSVNRESMQVKVAA